MFGLTNSIGALIHLGRWEEAERAGTEALPAAESAAFAGPAAGLGDLVILHALRGRLDDARDVLGALRWVKDHENPENRVRYCLAQSSLARASGDIAAAYHSASDAYGLRDQLGLSHSRIKHALVQLVDLALAMKDRQRCEESLGVLANLPPGQLTPWLHAQRDRLTARIGHERGDEPEAIAVLFQSAIDRFGTMKAEFDRGVSLLEFSHFLLALDRPREAQRRAEEASAILVPLGAAASASLEVSGPEVSR
jgi:hypothetical protein